MEKKLQNILDKLDGTKEWKVIEEAPNYAVSNYGDVVNIKTAKLIAGSSDRDGYLRVMLRVNGKGITRFRHRLAAIAFLGAAPEDKPFINHKDETRDNNFVGTAANNYQDGNLEWCSFEYNLNYGTRQERLTNKRRERIGTKYGSIQVDLIDITTNTIVRTFESITAAVLYAELNYRIARVKINSPEGLKISDTLVLKSRSPIDNSEKI